MHSPYKLLIFTCYGGCATGVAASKACIKIWDENPGDVKIGCLPDYIIFRINDSTLEIEDFYYNEFLNETKHIGIKIIKAVIKYKLDLLFTSRIGELSFYMLKDNFVDIYKINEDSTVKEVVDKYCSNRLEQIATPTHSLDESISTAS